LNVGISRYYMYNMWFTPIKFTHFTILYVIHDKIQDSETLNIETCDNDIQHVIRCKLCAAVQIAYTMRLLASRAYYLNKQFSFFRIALHLLYVGLGIAYSLYMKNGLIYCCYIYFKILSDCSKCIHFCFCFVHDIIKGIELATSPPWLGYAHPLAPQNKNARSATGVVRAYGI